MKPFSDKIARLFAIFYLITISKAGIRAIVCCASGLCLFYVVDWTWIQTEIATFLAELIGSQVQHHKTDIFLSNITLEISPECTYIDWFFSAFPFLWRNGGLTSNLVHIILLMIAIEAANMVRIYLSIKLTLNGVSWFWAHDLWDYITWYPSLILVILLWCRYQYDRIDHLVQ